MHLLSRYIEVVWLSGFSGSGLNCLNLYSISNRVLRAVVTFEFVIRRSGIEPILYIIV